MNTIRVDVSFDQVKKALRQLPAQDKLALWRLLDEDLDRPGIARRFAATVNTIRKAYAHVSEDEVMADAVKATRAVRRAKSRS